MERGDISKTPDRMKLPRLITLMMTITLVELLAADICESCWR